MESKQNLLVKTRIRRHIDLLSWEAVRVLAASWRAALACLRLVSIGTYLRKVRASKHKHGRELHGIVMGIHPILACAVIRAMGGLL